MNVGKVMFPPPRSFSVCTLPFHVIEDPVPDDEHPRDDHAGEQSCAKERCGDENFIVHRHHLTRGR